MDVGGRHRGAIHHAVVHVHNISASSFNGHSGDNAFGNRINFSTAVRREVCSIVIARNPKNGVDAPPEGRGHDQRNRKRTGEVRGRGIAPILAAIFFINRSELRRCLLVFTLPLTELFFSLGFLCIPLGALFFRGPLQFVELAKLRFRSVLCTFCFFRGLARFFLKRRDTRGYSALSTLLIASGSLNPLCLTQGAVLGASESISRGCAISNLFGPGRGQSNEQGRTGSPRLIHLARK